MNKHGLKRSIPEHIKREVRQRSKFGCVVCRSGLYDYEHIDPLFPEAKRHEANNICCLCPTCHAKVTRGHYPKEFIRAKYEEVQASGSESIRPPFSDIAFNDGKAELAIGGISYDAGLKSIVKYHGRDIFALEPSSGDEPSGVNAFFTDDNGAETLSIEGNVWTGALQAWDIEVVGSRLKVRKKKGVHSLVLRFDVPDRVVIEKLDMRLGDAHILVSEETYALARYDAHGDAMWMHAQMVHMGNFAGDATAIEFLTPLEAEWRDRQWIGKGNRLEYGGNQFVAQSGLGVACKPLGIIIGANCLKFGQGTVAIGGPRPLSKMRRTVFSKPDCLLQYIATGEF